MTFYLSKLWLWWLLAVVLAALLTAWLCRRAGRPRAAAVDERHEREVADARAAIERHEAKVNELASQRARELDELTTLRAQAGAIDELRARVRSLEAEAGAVPTLEAEVRTLRGEAERVPALEDEVVGLRRQLAEARADAVGGAADVRTTSRTRATAPDGAAAVLGRRVKADDLKAVEGIGPKIEQLLRADGIDSWRALADAPPERLRDVLAAAGPRFQVHDPGTWPAQAALLAEGRWAEFRELTDGLKGGRA